MATVKCEKCGNDVLIPEAVTNDVKARDQAEMQVAITKEKAIEQQQQSEIEKLRMDYEPKLAALQQELEAKTKQLADVQAQLQSVLNKVQP